MINQFCKVNLVPKALREVPTIDISQYDEELRTLSFMVYNGETLFDIPNGSTVTLRGTKPDNTGFEYECSYNGSIVTLDVKDQISVVAGRVICELRIVNEGILGTANVNIQVKRSALSSDIAISETDLPMVEEASRAFYLLDEANQALNDSTEALNNATEAISDVDAVRSELQGYVASASGYADNASQSANNSADSASLASTKANEASTYANNASTSATTASNKASEASQSATNAQTYASNASASASSASQSATSASASANTATTKANEASASATTASAKASEASSSADTATSKASEASSSADSASASATSAQESAEDAEAWAVGQRNGIDVPTTDPTYNNNAKYYALVNGGNQSKVYGIKRSLTSSSTAWTRTNDAEEKVANATLDGSSVQNDFDSIYPWSQIVSVNMANDGTVNAKYGDLNFAFDGSNGEVMTYIPPFYWNRWQDDEYEYIQISASRFTNSKFSDAFYIGRYTTSSGSHSYSGVASQVSTNITTFRNEAKAKGDGWGQLDYHYFLLQMLYLVEYADSDSQAKLGNGVSSVRYVATDTAVVAESNVNRIIIASDNANYVVGTYINVGTAQGSANVASMRKILSKETVTDGTAINFDGDAVNIAVGNVLWGGQQPLGQCDSLGMKSGCLNNDGKHAMIYRGIENFFGNIYQFVDGLNIKDRVAYICYDPSEYVVDKFTDPFVELGYTNASSNGYPKTMGYDENNPLVALPDSVGGSASTYYADYYYQNTGNRIARVGGYFGVGAAVGCFFWRLADGSGYTSVDVGSRLLKI